MTTFEELNRTLKASVTYIGIDPDRDKNGVALYRNSSEKLEALLNLSFFELLDYLKALKETDSTVSVVIEAGWMNDGNWHIRASDTARKAAKVGKYVGGNHEVGQKIVEMCEYLLLPYRLVVPKRHKVDAETFKEITKWCGRTNQEQRDAAMLVYGL